MIGTPASPLVSPAHATCPGEVFHICQNLALPKLGSSATDTLPDRDGLARQLAAEWPSNQLSAVIFVHNIKPCPVHRGRRSGQGLVHIPQSGRCVGRVTDPAPLARLESLHAVQELLVGISFAQASGEVRGLCVRLAESSTAAVFLLKYGRRSAHHYGIVELLSTRLEGWCWPNTL